MNTFFLPNVHPISNSKQQKEEYSIKNIQKCNDICSLITHYQLKEMQKERRQPSEQSKDKMNLVNGAVSMLYTVTTTTVSGGSDSRYPHNSRMSLKVRHESCSSRTL